MLHEMYAGGKCHRWVSHGQCRPLTNLVWLTVSSTGNREFMRRHTPIRPGKFHLCRLYGCVLSVNCLHRLLSEVSFVENGMNFIKIYIV